MTPLTSPMSAEKVFKNAEYLPVQFVFSLLYFYLFLFVFCMIRGNLLYSKKLYIYLQNLCSNSSEIYTAILRLPSLIKTPTILSMGLQTNREQRRNFVNFFLRRNYRQKIKFRELDFGLHLQFLATVFLRKGRSSLYIAPHKLQIQ